MRQRWLQYGFRELKAVRSLNDLRALLYNRLPFLIPRITGNPMVKRAAPLVLQIEPTNHCNLECVCCARKQMHRQKGFMELDLYERIIDDAANSKVRLIHLYLHGEPMLHPRIIDMVRYTKKRGLSLTVATNGMAFDTEVIEEMLRAGVSWPDRLIFSMLGHSKKLHEKMMKGVKHERVVANLRELLKIKNANGSHGPIVELHYCVTPANEHEASQCASQWKKTVDHVLVNTMSKQFSRFGTDSLKTMQRNTTCKYIWERLTVLWNGDVTPCMADIDGSQILGNMQEDSIARIWNSQQLNELRQAHRNRAFSSLPLCSRCDW